MNQCKSIPNINSNDIMTNTESGVEIFDSSLSADEELNPNKTELNVYCQKVLSFRRQLIFLMFMCISDSWREQCLTAMVWFE